MKWLMTTFKGVLATWVVIGVVVLTAGCETTSSQPAVTQPGGSSGAARPTSTPAAAASPTKPWGTSKEDVHVALAEGQTAEVTSGDQTYRVTLVKIVDGATSSNMFQVPAEGKKYLLFQVLVENAGTSALHLIGTEWALRDKNNFDYDPVFAPVGFAEGEALAGEVGPGGKQQGIVVFEIPQDAQPLFLKFDPNMFTPGEIYFDAE
ncbi:hypothetical protein HRbin26_02228 [bacterium HR26]|nr:hypothetical protein HRbin26_02228 [bacterium HR26]